MKNCILSLLLFLPVLASAAPLRVAFSDWPGWVAWEIAIKNGWFKEAGVDVEFLWLEYGPSINAFAAGKVDAVMMANGDALATTAAGAKNVMILLTDYSNGNDIIVALSSVKSVAALKGKKIGLEVGLVEHLLLANALKRADLSEADVTIVNVPTSQTPKLLAAGEVDAIGAWQPTAGEALKAVAGAHALYTSADEPGLIYDGLAVSPQSLADRRSDWLKLITLWNKIVHHIRDPATKEEAMAMMCAKSGASIDDFSRSLSGTRFLTLSEGLGKMNAGGGAGFGSLKYSSTFANAFNLKHGVYKVSENISASFDASLLTEAVGSMER